LPILPPHTVLPPLLVLLLVLLVLLEVEGAPPVPLVAVASAVEVEVLPPFPPVHEGQGVESTLPLQPARAENTRALPRIREMVRMGGTPLVRNWDAAAVLLGILCGSDGFA
jgi:hypothetical protein